MFTLIALVSWQRALGAPDKPDLIPEESENTAVGGLLCLPSGWRILLQENRSRPLVTLRSVQQGGWADDPAGQEGTAHLAEHLWFRSDVGGVPVAHALEAAGATYNAFTEAETVSFEATVPKGRWAPC